MRAVIALLALALVGATFQGSFIGSLIGAPSGGEESGDGSVTASLVVSRTTGPAPLGVHFDATGSTDTGNTDPFRTLGYAFDAGDANAATYALTGNLKRRHRGGPLFAYVYETPGTYTARVRVQDAAGNWQQASAVITVQAPDVVFAGTDTICVSPTSAFTGCPAGGATQTTLPLRTAYTGKRVLLNRGESFGSVNVRHDQVDYQIGAYGTGAKPIVSGLNLNDAAYDSTVGAHPERIAVYDISRGGGGSELPPSGEHLTYLRFDAGYLGSGPISWLMNNLPGGWAQSNFYMVRHVFIADSELQNGAQQSAFYLQQSGVMGSTIHSDGDPGHALRVWHAGRSYIGDTTMGRTTTAGVLSLKLHASGIALCDHSARVLGPTLDECATRRVVLARNTIGDVTSLSNWINVIAPQNNFDFADEGVEDVISEGSIYIRGGSVSQDGVAVGRRLTFRGESVQGGGAPNYFIANDASDGDCGTYFTASPSLPHEWCGPFYLGDVLPPQPDYPN